jgi:hypothetical protein
MKETKMRESISYHDILLTEIYQKIKTDYQVYSYEVSKCYRRGSLPAPFGFKNAVRVDRAVGINI